MSQLLQHMPSKATEDGRHYTPNLTKFQWVEHSEDNCMVCVLFGQDRRGKKKRKGLFTGRLIHSLLDLIETIKEKSPPSLLLDFKLRETISASIH